MAFHLNVKYQVPNDIPVHNQYISPEKLQSQNWLDKISDWTIRQKMKINEKKTKCIIFNYTNKYQFTTRLSVNNHPIEVIKSTLLLGTVVQDNLCWDLNTKEIVKKANARMELLRKVAAFCDNQDELKNIYILFVRSILEQSATVWHSSLSEENKNDLERVQNLENLNDRRENLCLTFAQRSSRHPKMRKMFPFKEKTYRTSTRNPEKYKSNMH